GPKQPDTTPRLVEQRSSEEQLRLRAKGPRVVFLSTCRLDCLSQPRTHMTAGRGRLEPANARSASYLGSPIDAPSRPRNRVTVRLRHSEKRLLPRRHEHSPIAVKSGTARRHSHI